MEYVFSLNVGFFFIMSIFLYNFELDFRCKDTINFENNKKLFSKYGQNQGKIIAIC